MPLVPAAGNLGRNEFTILHDLLSQNWGWGDTNGKNVHCDVYTDTAAMFHGRQFFDRFQTIGYL